MTRRDGILAAAQDAGTNFIYYDRKGDETLPRGEIEAAVKAGEITVDEIVAAFRKNLELG